MSEYIERSAVIDLITRRYELPELCTHEINSIPAADVVEVVRCKNCRYYQDAKVNEKGFLICPASSMEITEADYCSYGEHMDKEDKHEQ